MKANQLARLFAFGALFSATLLAEALKPGDRVVFTEAYDGPQDRLFSAEVLPTPAAQGILIRLPDGTERLITKPEVTLARVEATHPPQVSPASQNLHYEVSQEGVVSIRIDPIHGWFSAHIFPNQTLSSDRMALLTDPSSSGPLVYKRVGSLNQLVDSFELYGKRITAGDQVVLTPAGLVQLGNATDQRLVTVKRLTAHGWLEVEVDGKPTWLTRGVQGLQRRRISSRAKSEWEFKSSASFSAVQWSRIPDSFDDPDDASWLDVERAEVVAATAVDKVWVKYVDGPNAGKILWIDQREIIQPAAENAASGLTLQSKVYSPQLDLELDVLFLSPKLVVLNHRDKESGRILSYDQTELGHLLWLVPQEEVPPHLKNGRSMIYDRALFQIDGCLVNNRGERFYRGFSYEVGSLPPSGAVEKRQVAAENRLAQEVGSLVVGQLSLSIGSTFRIVALHGGSVIEIEPDDPGSLPRRVVALSHDGQLFYQDTDSSNGAKIEWLDTKSNQTTLVGCAALLVAQQGEP